MAGSTTGGLDSLYEGQFKQHFHGFGRLILSDQQQLVAGWWQDHQTLYGQGIFFRNGIEIHQGIFRNQDYLLSPAESKVVVDFRQRF